MSEVIAKQFLVSKRGQFIMSRALYEAIESLEKVPAPHTPKGDILDMKYLLTNLFPLYAQIKQAEKEFQQTKSQEE